MENYDASRLASVLLLINGSVADLVDFRDYQLRTTDHDVPVLIVNRSTFDWRGRVTGEDECRQQREDLIDELVTRYGAERAPAEYPGACTLHGVRIEVR